MFNLKNANAHLTNVQSMTSENLSKEIVDALLLQILLSFDFNIIKFEKTKTYKDQCENGYQR